MVWLFSFKFIIATIKGSKGSKQKIINRNSKNVQMSKHLYIYKHIFIIYVIEK